MRVARIGTLAAIAFIAAALPCYAFSQKVGVPPGTISVTIITAGTNVATGTITSISTNAFCPAGSTITVTQPDNTSTTVYVSAVNFTDANGNTISTVEIIQGDSGGSGNGGGGGSRPVPTKPQPN